MARWGRRDFEIRDYLRGVLGVLMSLGIIAVLVLAFMPRPTGSSTTGGNPPAGPSPVPASASPQSSEEDAVSSAAIEELTVIGDGWTSGVNADAGAEARWPSLVAERLGIQTRAAAASGSGYISAGVTGSTFAGLAEQVDPSTGAILVFGSSNDSDSTYEAINSAASDLYAALQQRAPGVPLVVIGPAYFESAANLSDAELANRDAVRDAATAAGLTFVDPVAEDWFAAEDPALIGANGMNPSDAGQSYLAERIAPVIEALLST